MTMSTISAPSRTGPKAAAQSRSNQNAPAGLIQKKSPRSSKLGRGRGLLSYRPLVFILWRWRKALLRACESRTQQYTVVADAKSILWPMCAFDAPPRVRRPSPGNAPAGFLLA